MDMVSLFAQLPIFLAWFIGYLIICWVVPRAIYYCVRDSECLDEKEAYKTKIYLKYVLWTNIIIALIISVCMYFDWAFKYRRTNDYKPQILITEKQ
jgi:hypothetical protein